MKLWEQGLQTRHLRIAQQKISDMTPLRFRSRGSRSACEINGSYLEQFDALAGHNAQTAFQQMEWELRVLTECRPAAFRSVGRATWLKVTAAA
ncbi:MAG: hypothetical protein RI566_13670 [Sediminimonas sp.]|nr:hypothetical protein [Sediminimonas sp.]